MKVPRVIIDLVTMGELLLVSRISNIGGNVHILPVFKKAKEIT